MVALVHIISKCVDNPAQTIGTSTNLSCMQALSAIYVRLHASRHSHYMLSLAYLLLRAACNGPPPMKHTRRPRLWLAAAAVLFADPTAVVALTNDATTHTQAHSVTI